MPQYAYVAYSSAQTKTGGQVDAESERAAAERLLERGLQPIEIRPLRAGWRPGHWLASSRNLTCRDRAVLARQLADLVAAGMPVLDGLRLLEDQAQGTARGRAAAGLRSAIHAGSSLGRAMGTLPRDFRPLHVSLVKAGERAGLLSTVLHEIADLEENQAELLAKLRAALMYPTITAVVGLATVLVILNVVIPRLSSIFDEMNQALPLITRLLLLLSHGAQVSWKYLVILLAGGVIATRMLGRSPAWVLRKDRLLLRLPHIGTLLESLQTARFARVLGALLRNGVPMLPALEVTAATLENSWMRSRLSQSIARVHAGDRLGSALESGSAFSRVVCGMISVGETTGNLEQTLQRIADSSARDASRGLQVLIGLLEPALIITMGLFVAFIVAAVILPIFQVNLGM